MVLQTGLWLDLVVETTSRCTAWEAVVVQGISSIDLNRNQTKSTQTSIRFLRQATTNFGLTQPRTGNPVQAIDQRYKSIKMMVWQYAD